MESSPTSQTPSNKSDAPGDVILDYQRPSYEKLLAIAKACFAIDRSKLTIRPRTNTLIIGPSGSGKSFLARAVASALDLPLLHISISEWIPLGASERGASITWPMIALFLMRKKKADGQIIFLDEIDKIAADSSWNVHLRNEIFRLLDLQLPVSISIDGDILDEDERALVLDRLQNHTLILAAGAFQHLWEHQVKPSVGFGAKAALRNEPDLAQLAYSLPRELVNRFRSSLVVLPQLQKADYQRMLNQAKDSVPEHLRKTFLRLGQQRIEEAVRCRHGCRFVEELLLDAIIEERKAIHWKNDPQPKGEPA